MFETPSKDVVICSEHPGEDDDRLSCLRILAFQLEACKAAKAHIAAQIVKCSQENHLPGLKIALITQSLNINF
jgi:hypothetical protein